MKQSSKCAIGGITSALSLVLMISVAVIPFLTYALPALAGIIILLIVIEIDNKWAFGVYSAVAILSVLLVPDKEVAAMYLAFFGYYPILKQILEKNLPSFISWIIKCAVFIVSMLASYWVLIKVTGLEIDELEEFGLKAIPILLGIGLFAFVFYDILLSKLIIIYNYKFKKYFHRYFK